jgi:NAD(P)-dependent dehydrogenase (short-subunit alcohol dehydrogenase family)
VNYPKNVLITGASGLLGRALISAFLDAGSSVWAQCHSNQPFEHENCRWLHADFSDSAGIRGFLQQHRQQLNNIDTLINNYGPITHKPTKELTSEDFYHDFHHNVITAYEITAFLIKTLKAPLKSVINVGFEFVGQQKAYRNILTYATAKNALHLVTLSLQEAYPKIRFHMPATPTLTGAEVPSKKGPQVPPSQIAKEILAMTAG